MPNVITHGLHAQDVIQQLDASGVTQAIQDFPQPYLFGSNGPDYLFYYLVLKPFKGYELNETITKLGNRVHSEKVSAFYEAGIKHLKSLNNEDRKLFTAYLAGHLMHWSLDSIAHPYIFHKTGKIEGETRYHHVRFESMIDTLMITLYKKGELKDYPSYKFTQLNNHEKQVIARGYQSILKAIFGLDIKRKTLITAMSNMTLALHIFMDPNSIKKKSVHLLEEKLLKNPWVVTKHFVYGEADMENDLLNLQHNPWHHPCHQDWVYTSSFFDLYEEAIERGVKAMKLLNEDLQSDTNLVSEFVADRKYDSGIADDLGMRYFDIVY